LAMFPSVISRAPEECFFCEKEKLMITPFYYDMNDTKMMLGSKGILTPLIPDCYVLCTLAIFKNIRNPLIFL